MENVVLRPELDIYIIKLLEELVLISVDIVTTRSQVKGGSKIHRENK